jgi:hypothetical protein
MDNEDIDIRPNSVSMIEITVDKTGLSINRLNIFFYLN